MSKTNVVEVAGRDMVTDPLTDLLRACAEQLIYRAIEVELEDLLSAHSERRTVDGKAGVVRNGYLPARELQTGLGPERWSQKTGHSHKWNGCLKMGESLEEQT